MRVSPLLALALLGVMTFSGCLGDDRGGGQAVPDVTLPPGREDPANNTTMVPPATGLGPVAAPSWKVGDYWEIASAALHGDATVWTNYTAVVVTADGVGYVLGAGDNQTTYLDGLLVDLLPIGAVDASLKPTWRGGAFPMFQWPLASGATWSADATLDDDDPVPLTFNVGFDAGIETPYGLRPGYRLSALGNGTLLFAYTYVPAAGWFTLFEEFDDAGKRVRWITVTGWGSGWSESAYTLATETLLDRLIVYEKPEDPRSTFTVGGEYSYLFLWARGRERGDVLDHHVFFLGPDHTIRATYGVPAYRPPGTPGCGFLGCLGVPNQWTQWGTFSPDAGEWTVVFENGGAGNLEARAIGVTNVVHQL